MPADSIGVTGAYLNAGATAQSVELTELVREVEVSNLHASQLLYISLAEGTFAANPAAAAVVEADDLIVVPPFTKAVIWRNTRVKKAVNLNIIASGAATKCYVEGHVWMH